MYLNHFKLKDMPFSITPNIDYFLNSFEYEKVFNTLLISLKSGDGFIKVTGEVGTGKTLLCRKLLDTLDDSFRTAYLAAPIIGCVDTFKAVAQELGLSREQGNGHDWLSLINAYLIEQSQLHKKVILIIDEAQALSDEALEAIRLLTNLETKSRKLLQVVLVGQPELDQKLRAHHMRQLRQRIIFSCHLPALTAQAMPAYLGYRLYVAGSAQPELFTPQAQNLLFKASQGFPRLINILAHKAMLVAYGQGCPVVDTSQVYKAIEDTEFTRRFLYRKRIGQALGLVALGVVMFAIAFYTVSQ